MELNGTAQRRSKLLKILRHWTQSEVNIKRFSTDKYYVTSYQQNMVEREWKQFFLMQKHWNGTWKNRAENKRANGRFFFLSLLFMHRNVPSEKENKIDKHQALVAHRRCIGHLYREKKMFRDHMDSHTRNNENETPNHIMHKMFVFLFFRFCVGFELYK